MTMGQTSLYSLHCMHMREMPALRSQDRSQDRAGAAGGQP
jgi:hypothetical protein